VSVVSLFVPLVVAIVAAVAVLSLATRGVAATGRRPWWGNPWLWLGVSALSVALGLFVWPGLFGGFFLFLPFVWIRAPRRAGDARGNGNGSPGVPRRPDVLD
jgi:hypothetical protein